LTFNCFGCGAHGGLLWFIATVRKCTTAEAFKWLEDNGGFNPDTMESERLLDLLAAFYQPKVALPETIPAYSPRAIEEWVQYVHPYMTDGAEELVELGIEPRRIPEENLRRLRVGWDPDDDRIILPHFWKDVLVGWQARRIWPWQGVKYRSTPDFPKHLTLYNYDPRKRYSTLLVVESPMSVVSKIHLFDGPLDGIQMVATFGMEMPDKQVGLITRADHVIYWMDSDEGGWKAMEGSKNLPGLLDRTSPHTRVSVVDSPYDADPADHTDDDFVDLVRSPLPHVLWKPRRGSLLEYVRG
jgi:DNA primase